MDTQQAHQKNIDDTEEIASELAAMRCFWAMLGLAKEPRVVAAEEDLRRFVDGLSQVHRTQGEAQVCALFDWAIYSEDTDVLGKLHTGVVSNRREVALPCGKADRVLMHADGTATVVEIKAAGSRRDHAQGLGQALLYAEALRATGVPDVQMALVVAGDADPWVESACKTAGVSYLAFPLVQISTVSDYGAAALRGSKWQPE